MTKSSQCELTTGYLTEALDLGGLASRQVTLTVLGERSMAVEILADPNACTLDSFGDPQICTKIGVLPRRATLRLIEERERDQLFALEPEDGAGPELRLAILQGGGAAGGIVARLLVLGDDGCIQRLITMEPPRGAWTPSP
jgi:hypothetical protein